MPRIFGIAGGSYAPWLPSRLAGLALWLDANHAPALTQSGGVASAIACRAGSGITFSAAGAARPSVIASGLNSRTILRFDGAAQYMTAADALDLTGDKTFFAVLKSNAAGEILTHYTAGTYIGWGFTSGSSRINIWTNNGGWVEETTAIVGATRALGFAIASGALTFYLGGTADGTGTGCTNGGSTSSIGLGAKADGTAKWSGDLAEICVWSRALGTAELAAWFAYALAKWGCQ